MWSVSSVQERRLLSPASVTLAYLLLGGAWIVFSDRLVEYVVGDPALRSWVQTGKGWLFVAASGLLIYVVTARQERRYVAANERLKRALRQTTVLHRILRHNLRNVCTVIQGNVDLINGDLDRPADSVSRIQEGTEELVALSEKTKHLRILLQEDPQPESVDVVSVIDDVVAGIRRRHPDVTVETDLPTSARILTVDRLEFALQELAENAIEHHDRDEPTLWLSVEYVGDGTVQVDVADDGPGIPEMERAVLAHGFERPTFHSEGLGLWFVRTVVDASGGSLSIEDNEPRGSIVRLTFQAPTEEIRDRAALAEAIAETIR